MTAAAAVIFHWRLRGGRQLAPGLGRHDFLLVLLVVVTGGGHTVSAGPVQAGVVKERRTCAMTRVALLARSSCGPTTDTVGGVAGGVAGEEGFGRGQLRP